MSMPPAWKVKRELLAARDQIKAWFLLLFAPVRKIYYDRHELKEIRVHIGDRDLQKKLIIYLIYQPRGLVESNFIAIEFFRSQGYEVLIVSNGEIPTSNIERLKPLSWKIIIRKNIGYDFGGYRCGLHYLKQLKIDLKVIHLVNDSIWFPVVDDKHFLYKLEAGVSDFGGAVLLNGVKSLEGGLVLSYWMTVQESLFKALEFWDYWRQYIPTGNKTLTVKLGERGISRHMRLAGRNISGVFTVERFLSEVQAASTRQLELTLKYASFTDPSFLKECALILGQLKDTKEWRDLCLDFIERVTQKRNFLHSFCYASIAIVGVPFIKKNNLRLQFLMREKYIHAVYAGDLPSPNLHILEEIEKSLEVSNQSTAFR